MGHVTAVVYWIVIIDNLCVIMVVWGLFINLISVAVIVFQ